MKTIKKNLFLTGLILVAVMVFSSCGSSTTKEKPATSTEVAKVQYTCPMHAEVISDKPGDCPKCGMPLVEKK